MTNQAATQSGQSQPLAYVVYVSSARIKMTDAQLEEILEAARHNNQKHGVTGILAYWDGNFIQYIEGPAPKIEQLMHNLDRDPRHGGIIVMQRGDVAARAFPDWSMAFDRKIAGQHPARPGVSRFLSDGFLTADPANFSPDANRLLEVFRQQLR